MSSPARAAERSGSGIGYVVLISVSAALGGFLFGYDTAVVNGTVGALERHFRADPGRLGFAIAAALLGSAVGVVMIVLKRGNRLSITPVTKTEWDFVTALASRPSKSK